MRIVHWFRNDLRLNDNTALAAAAGRASQLLPLFIVDPALASQHDSSKRRSYLAGCLNALSQELAAAGCPLLILEGPPPEVLGRLVEKTRAELVTFNRDYSPYAVRRDREVANTIAKAGAKTESFKDRAVFESDEVLTQSGTPFRVFTPYRNAWTTKWQSSPQAIQATPRLPHPLSAPGFESQQPQVARWIVEDFAIPVGEQTAVARLTEFLDGPLHDYAEHRDIPALDGTSRLSAALRFGTVSIRTCVNRVLERRRTDNRNAAGAAKWLDELIWRDFYQAILAVHPHVLSGPFRPEYRDIEWNEDQAGFEAWCAGQTGYPIVDAAMRQLTQTGWMHNRARMIVASFLVKDLLIDWRKGEKFFMQQLIDGDPASNNGGWQWAASTGTDAQPYFRIFNPTSQGKRYDPDGDYVRRFIPELGSTAKRHIHSPWTGPNPPAGYPGPIVDHSERRLAAITRFEAARSQAK